MLVVISATGNPSSQSSVRSLQYFATSPSFPASPRQPGAPPRAGQAYASECLIHGDYFFRFSERDLDRFFRGNDAGPSEVDDFVFFDVFKFAHDDAAHFDFHFTGFFRLEFPI